MSEFESQSSAALMPLAIAWTLWGGASVALTLFYAVPLTAFCWHWWHS